MMISHKTKFAPQKFKGNIKSIPLGTIIDLISFTCILKVYNGEKSGSLYFENGSLIGSRLNNEFNIHKAEDILNWKFGTYSYQKWKNDFEVDIKQLIDVLYLIEIAYFDARVYVFQNEDIIDIRCSEGKIVSISPKPKNINSFFKTMINYEKGKVIVNLNSGQTGDLKLYFTDIFNNIKPSEGKKPELDAKKKEKRKKIEYVKTKTKKITVNDNVTKTKSVRKNPELDKLKINKEIIKDSFTNLKDMLEDTLIAVSLFTSSSGVSVFSYNTKEDQTTLFSSLGKNLNALLEKSDFALINQYYMLDLEENKLVFTLNFKAHHFALLLKKDKIKLGYLLNIIKPILTTDYKNALILPI